MGSARLGGRTAGVGQEQKRLGLWQCVEFEPYSGLSNGHWAGHEQSTAVGPEQKGSLIFLHSPFCTARKEFIAMTSNRDDSELANEKWHFEKEIDLYLSKALGRAEKIPPPLRAFAVDRAAALSIPYVDDVSQKILKSGVFYFLGKEVAHIALGHALAPRGGWSPEQELEAQDIVLTVFEQIGTVPAGATFYFRALGALDDRFLTSAGTSRESLRLRTAQIAERISQRPDLYSWSEPNSSAAIGLAREISRTFANLSVFVEQGPATVRQNLVDHYSAEPLRMVCPG